MSRLSIENIHINTEISNDERQTHDSLLTKDKPYILEVKHIELRQWQEKGVHKEVTNEGQDYITLRWVVKEKHEDLRKSNR